MISHWDDARTWRGERGHIAGTWTSLTGRRSHTVGVKRIQVDPGMWATPLHLEGAEEEIFYVLGGSGVSVQWDGEQTLRYEVREGDCIVHLALENAHTLRAGSDGLDVLAFGQRSFAHGITWLPRGRRRLARQDLGPGRRRRGPPVHTGSGSRPARARRALASAGEHRQHGGRGGVRADRRDGRAPRARPRPCRRLATHGREALRRRARQAHEPAAQPLGRRGDLRRPPRNGDGCDLASPARFSAEREEHGLRAGSVIASPAGTGRPLELRAGEDGMRVLAYGTREPNDITYYPRSGKVLLRGVGLVARLGEPLDYWDGED